MLSFVDHVNESVFILNTRGNPRSTLNYEKYYFFYVLRTLRCLLNGKWVEWLREWEEEKEIHATVHAPRREEVGTPV